MSEANYDEWSDAEVDAQATSILFDCGAWSFSENGKDCAFYHCGVDGEGYYEQPVVHFCNTFADWYPIAEKYGMNMDVKGRASIPKSVSGLDEVISHMCEGELGRAVMICFLKMSDAQND